jgi:hypothetical protein
MMVRKYLCLIFGVLVFSLFGCGEKEAAVSDASAAPAVSSQHAAHAVADAEEDDEDEDDGDDEDDRPKQFSRDRFLQSWTKNCVQMLPMLARDKKPDPAKVEPYCACVTEDVFGNMSDIEGWMKEWRWRMKMLQKVSTDKTYKPSAADQARLDRANQEWAERYARSENTCMQRHGVTMPHAY